MNHDQDRSTDLRLMRLIHGELAADEAAALEDEIARDDQLAARHRRLATAWTDLQAPAVAPAPDDFLANVVAAAKREEHNAIRWSLAPAWARAGSMAALVLGVVLGTSLGIDTSNGLIEPELTGDQEAYWLLSEPASLAESFWVTLEETEGRLENGASQGEQVR